MHLQDGPQLDLPAQVAKVKQKARPWKSIIALILAIAAAVVSGWAHRHFHDYFDSSNIQYQVIAAGCAVAFCVFASVATYRAFREGPLGTRTAGRHRARRGRQVRPAADRRVHDAGRHARAV